MSRTKTCLTSRLSAMAGAAVPLCLAATIAHAASICRPEAFDGRWNMEIGENRTKMFCRMDLKFDPILIENGLRLFMLQCDGPGSEEARVQGRLKLDDDCSVRGTLALFYDDGSRPTREFRIRGSATEDERRIDAFVVPVEGDDSKFVPLHLWRFGPL
jgi:hypothetical protein